MSWTIHVNPVAVEGFEAALQEARARTAESGQLDTSEAQSQADLAMQMARDIVKSGVIGYPAGIKVGANLSGHANPGHQPREGWANDMINVGVYQST